MKNKHIIIMRKERGISTVEEDIKYWLGVLKADNFNNSFIELVENLIRENKELKNKYQKIKNEINGQISIAERNYDIEELNEYAKGMYDAYKSIQNLF